MKKIVAFHQQTLGFITQPSLALKIDQQKWGIFNKNSLQEGIYFSDKGI